MKKSILFMTAMLFYSISMSALNNISLLTKNGMLISGKLISMTDTTALVFVNNSNTNIEFPASKIICISNKKGTLAVNKNGKLVQVEQVDEQKVDPNKSIENAIKKAGAVSLAFGIPCLAAGLATCIAGHSGGLSLFTASDCLEASYYLLGTGAAMTIVGIPLYVEGKKMSEIKFNYTGNGIGVVANL